MKISYLLYFLSTIVNVFFILKILTFILTF